MLRKLVKTSAALLAAVVITMASGGMASAASLAVAKTTIISASPSGEPSTNLARGSFGTVMSSNGRWVAFTSRSDNLIPSETFESRQTFLYDRLFRTMEIVSRTTSDVLADSGAAPAGVSDNGRYVVFNSAADNLATEQNATPGDNVYIRDRQAGSTSLATKTVYGGYAQPHSVSRDGKIIAYLATTSTGGSGAHVIEQQAYVYNRTTGVTTAMPGGSQPLAYDSDGLSPTVSGNGRYVAYGIVGSQQPSGLYGMVSNYRYDLSTSTSVQFDTGGQTNAVLSNDGSKALYYWVAAPTSGVYSQRDLYLTDVASGNRQLVASDVLDQGTGTNIVSLSISDNHNRASYQSYDQTAGSATHVYSLSDATDVVVPDWAGQGFATLSADGQLLAYDGRPDLPDVGNQAMVAHFASDAPIVGVTSPQANSTVSGTVNIGSSVISGENYSHIFYVFNSASQIVASHYQANVPASTTSLSYSWNTTSLPNGTYKVYVSAKDVSNHKDAYSTDYYYVTVAN